MSSRQKILSIVSIGSIFGSDDNKLLPLYPHKTMPFHKPHVTPEQRYQITLTHQISRFLMQMVMDVLRRLVLVIARLVGHGRLQSVDHSGQDLVGRYVSAERGILVDVRQIYLRRGLSSSKQRPHFVLGQGPPTLHPMLLEPPTHRLLVLIVGRPARRWYLCGRFTQHRPLSQVRRASAPPQWLVAR